MTHEIGVFKKGSITAIQQINDSEYEEYEKSARQLRRFSDDQQTFLIVFFNHKFD